MIETKIQRNSSIEILKILAIIMVVVSHSMPDGDTSVYSGAIDINTVTTNIHLILAGYMKNMGQIGNNIFFACSTWFLLDSSKVKIGKITNMIGDCFFISVSMLGVFTLLGYEFPIMYLIEQFFPVTFANCWFVTCYLLLYAIHPILNNTIKGMKKESLLCFNICFFILYNCIGFIMGNSLFYYSRLIGFIGIYFLVAYFRLYLKEISLNKKINVIFLATGIVGWVASSWLTAILSNNFGIFENQMQRWNNIMNPCFILIAIALLNLFRRKSVYNSTVNYISSLSLLIYLIHSTKIMRNYVRYDIFEYIKNTFGFENLFVWLILFALFNLVAGTLLAIIYNKTIQKYIHYIFEKISKMVVRLYGIASNKILAFR